MLYSSKVVICWKPLSIPFLYVVGTELQHRVCTFSTSCACFQNDIWLWFVETIVTPFLSVVGTELAQSAHTHTSQRDVKRIPLLELFDSVCVMGTPFSASRSDAPTQPSWFDPAPGSRNAAGWASFMLLSWISPRYGRMYPLWPWPKLTASSRRLSLQQVLRCHIISWRTIICTVMPSFLTTECRTLKLEQRTRMDQTRSWITTDMRETPF